MYFAKKKDLAHDFYISGVRIIKALAGHVRICLASFKVNRFTHNRKHLCHFCFRPPFRWKAVLKWLEKGFFFPMCNIFPFRQGPVSKCCGVQVVSSKGCSLCKNGGKTYILTLNVPVTTAVDDIHKHFSLFFRENKT